MLFAGRTSANMMYAHNGDFPVNGMFILHS